MCTGWTCGYDIIVFLCFHTFDVDLCFFLSIFNITHRRCRTSAACLTKRHLYKITNGVQILNNVLCKVCVYEVKQTARKQCDLALWIRNILFDRWENVTQRNLCNVREASSFCQSGKEHRQMTDHRLSLCKWCLSHRCNTEHGVEQLTVRNCIQCKFLDGIWILFHALLTDLHDHIWNLKTTATDFLTSSALETEILDLARTSFINEEVSKHNANAAGINFGTIYMAAN